MTTPTGGVVMKDEDDFVLLTPKPDTDKPIKMEEGEEGATQGGGSGPTQDQSVKMEVVKEQEEGPSSIDLVFACDCTGSMGSYIRSAQDNIRSIVDAIQAAERVDVRFGLVCYRDHPPQDSTYASKVFSFTADVGVMKAHVDTMKAQGGGDGPESVADALHDVLHMDWRPNATKVAVLISDAPPHGLGESGDGFPNGCPCGHDPLDLARQCATKDITIYAVGCEPALSGFRHAKDFFISLAEITGGQATVLSSASLLSKVILGGALEEIALTKLMKDVEREVDECAKEGIMDESAVTDRVAAVLTRDRKVAWQMNTNVRHTSKKAAFIKGSRSLNEARDTLMSAKPEVFAEEDEAMAAAVTSSVEVAAAAPVSHYQCERMVAKSISKRFR